MKKILVLLVISFAFVSLGCSSICPPRHDYRKAGVPEWIYELPQKEGWIYTWGSSGQSIGFNEVKAFAEENARKTLALLLGAKIVHKTRKLEIFAPDASTRVKPIASWKNVEYEVVEEWFDKEGKAGLGYQYYVLVRTPVSKD